MGPQLGGVGVLDRDRLGVVVKRAPIARKTPMRQAGGQMRRSRVRPVSKRKAPGVTDAVAGEVIGRSGGICERCRREPGTELHHRVTRGRGGPHDAFVLVHLCATCHHVHAHGQNEYPWMVPGYFIRGKYHGSDEGFRAEYPEETS